MYLFIFSTLYMFRAHCAHHQEGQIVSIQPPTESDSYQRLYWHNLSLLTMSTMCSKHVVVVTPSSLSRLLVILYQDFLGKFSVQGWFAIAFPFYLLIFVRSLFLVFSSTSLRHLFLYFTISFNFSKPKPVFSFTLSIHLNRGLPCLLHPSTCPIIMSRSSVPFVEQTKHEES